MQLPACDEIHTQEKGISWLAGNFYTSEIAICQPAYAHIKIPHILKSVLQAYRYITDLGVSLSLEGMQASRECPAMPSKPNTVVA